MIDFRLTKTRKSQAEAFGLVFIIALVFVIFAIIMRIEQGRTSSDIKTSYEVTELSSSTVNTMLSTVVRSCNNKMFSEIIIDCVRNPNSMCTATHTSCDVFVQSSRELLNEVFERVNLDYFIRFASEGRALPEALSTPYPPGSVCSEDLRGEDFVLPLNPGTLVLTLVVCAP